MYSLIYFSTVLLLQLVQFKQKFWPSLYDKQTLTEIDITFKQLFFQNFTCKLIL